MNLKGCYLCGAGCPEVQFFGDLFVFRCTVCGCHTKAKPFQEAMEDWDEGHTFPVCCRSCSNGDGSWRPCGKESEKCGWVVICPHFNARPELKEDVYG